MPGTSPGATLLEPDHLEIREYPIPDIPSDGALVEVEMARACGSDLKYPHRGKPTLLLPADPDKFIISTPDPLAGSIDRGQRRHGIRRAGHSID